MSNAHIPMIPSSAAGPLGILHLPRLWLKASLESVGKLNPDYPGIGQGFDMMVISSLGLTADAVRAFIKENHPTYIAFESWIMAQPGVRLDRATIYKLNQGILGYHHDDETRKGILQAAGCKDDGSVPGSAVDLNAIEDWTAFHAAELA